MDTQPLVMSDAVVAAPAAAMALATKYAGNVPRYTSYPTAPHFHAGIGETDYRRWLSALDPDRPISLYLHIPFCRRLCWSCGCNMQVVNNHGPVTAYVDALLHEIELFRP